MSEHNTLGSTQKCYDSGHASLCLLGRYLRQIGFFEPLEQRVQVKQKVLTRTEIRLDSSWGSEAMITWLLSRGYQVTGKFKSTSRMCKLARGITTWSATSSPGREVAPVPEPVEFLRET